VQTERTCITCGRTARRDELLRLVLDPGGRPAIDFGQKLPGRGAYVCWQRDCAEGSDARLSRAFHQKVERSDDGWAAGSARRFLQRRVVELCATMQKSGSLKSGAHTVQMALKKGWGSAGLLASDAGEDGAERFRRQCERRELPVFDLPLTTEEFGKAVGKGVRSVAVIEGSSLVTALELTLQRWWGFL